MAKKKWINKAVSPETKGAFKHKAEAVGKSTKAFAAEHKGDSGRTGKQARLALTLMGMKHTKAKMYGKG